MDDSATTRTRFETPAPLALEVAFDGGRITSDGGLCWLAETDEELGVCEAIARRAPEWRGSSIRHPLGTLVRQRVYQVACGHEDQNDANALRGDPLLKLVLGRLPETGEDLASQPALSRLENAPKARRCLRIARALGGLYVRERAKDGAPERVLLDLDSADDPTHGEQGGSRYRGYYKTHMYHPLLVFDGETGQLVTAVLRPGNPHAGHGAVAVLRRVAEKLREEWPGVAIERSAPTPGSRCPPSTGGVRKRGSATPSASSPIPGSRPSPRAPASAGRAGVRRARGREGAAGVGRRLPGGHLGSLAQGGVPKAEAMEEGANTRFVVTSRREAEEPKELYDWYVDRGRPRVG